MKKYKLGDLIDVSRGKSLAGEFYATSGKLVRLTMGNFDYINNCFKQNTSKDNLFFSGKVEEKFILNAGDIITPLTEQTPGLLGSTARIPESGKYIQSQDVALVKCKKDKLDDGFAYYLVSSECVKKQLGAAAQQTKIRHTSPDKIKDCTVYIPEISIQKKIGNILSALDKRIENLRAQNRILEQTAKTIYDYTFLQCAGHQTTYNKTLNRNIPINWEVKRLGDLLTIKNGKDHKHLKEGSFAVYGSGGLMRKVDSFLYDGESVLIPRKGTLNNVMYVDEKFWTVDTMFYTVMNEPYYGKYIYYSVRDIDFMARNSGTGVPSMTSGYLNTISIMLPDSRTLETFNNQVTPLFRKVQLNTKQIESLTTQRNTLLPLLMTGQVEV